MFLHGTILWACHPSPIDPYDGVSGIELGVGLGVELGLGVEPGLRVWG